MASYKMKIKEILNAKIILEDEDHNLIYWPKDKLAEDIKINDTVNISINEKPGKEILNELLKKKK